MRNRITGLGRALPIALSLVIALSTFAQADGIATGQIVASQGPTAFLLILTEQSAGAAYARSLEASGVQPSAGLARVPADAITRANAAGREAALAAKRQQDRVLPHILSAAPSAKVIYQIQRALNAIAVETSVADSVRLAALSDVKQIIPMEMEFPTVNKPVGSNAVPLMDVPSAWTLPAGVGNADGTGIKIGIIDTGVDYLHADFGGAGLLTDYQNNNRTVAPDAYYPTAKVVGGTDFAGDNYNGTAGTIAADPDPMDCTGHGSHVAGIAAGVGVNADGTPYAGPYNGSTPFGYATQRLHPGVAPKALLYSLRVFGCGGGTNLTNLAIDWSMDPNGDLNLSDHLDVINMSLGSDFGFLASSSAVAADAAAYIGVATVVSAGNAGDTHYIVGSPGSGDRVTTVAASTDDGLVAGIFRVNSPPGIAGFYGNTISLQFGGTPPAGGVTGTLVQALDPADGAGPLTTDGCSPLTNAAAIAGNVAFIDRGTCGFLQKAQNAAAAGAIGVVIASNSAAAIGNMAGVDVATTVPTILITQADGNTLRTNLPSNPSVTFFNAADMLASFSSRGSRGGALSPRQKPDVAAPGNLINSAQTGTTCTGVAPSTGCLTVNASGFIPGSQVLTISGTSMACPQIAGLSALMKQIHPDWSTEEVKASIVNTAAHDLNTRPEALGNKHAVVRMGAGRADAFKAASTTAMVFNAEEAGAVGLAFAEDFVTPGSRTKKLRVENKSAAPVTYDLSVLTISDAPGMSFSLPGGTQITVPAESSATFDVQWNVDPTILKHARDVNEATAQTSVGLVVTANRQWITEESSNLILSVSGVEKLRVPLYGTSRPASMMSGPAVANGAGATGTGTLALTGTPVCTGTLAATCTGTFNAAPFDEVSLVTPFELVASSGVDPVNAPRSADIQYGGVAYDSVNNVLMFGVSTWGDWGTANETVVNIYIDANNDGTYDRILFGASAGVVGKLFATSNGNDAFVNAILTLPGTVSVPAGALRYMNADPATLDSGLHRSNVVVLNATPAALGLASPTTTFKWKIVTCPSFAPLCKQLNGFQYDEVVGPFTWASNAAGLSFNGTKLAQDVPGTIPVSWDTTKFAANGTLGALLLHTHNTSGTRAQVIPLAAALTADLGVTVGAGPLATKGQNVTLTVTVTNNGTAATAIQVPITIPAGMTYVSDDGAGTFNTSSEVWTIAALAPAASATLHIVETLTSNEPQPVIAQITASTPPDTSSANNTALIYYTPFRTAELVLNENVSAPTVLVGGTVTYTFTATNNGPDEAYSINLGDAFPAVPGLNATTFTASKGVYNSATHTWNIAGLDSGRTATLALNVTAPNMAGPLTNQGTANSTVVDPNAVNNTASAVTNVLSPANVTGTKTRAGNTWPGQTVTYTVTLSNSSAFDQQNNPADEFTDILPAQLTLVSANASSGTALATIGTNTVTWNGNIPAGGSVTITITATINAIAPGTSVSNQGTISYDADGNGTNEASRQTDDPGVGGATDPTSFTSTSPSNIAVANMTVAGQFFAGGAITYTVTLTNSGPSMQLDNAGDEFAVTLPGTLTLTGASANSGTASTGGATAHWNGSLASGASVTITINATVSAGAVAGSTISAQGTANYDADGNATNEASKVTDDPGTGAPNDPTSFVVSSPSTITGATKTVVPSAAAPGSILTYTVKFTNSGAGTQLDNPGDEFTDTLPATVTITSATANSGTTTNASNIVHWNGSLAPGATVTITIIVRVNANATGSTIANTGTINYDADGNGTNESTLQTTTATVPLLAAVPAFSPLMLMLLAFALAAAALVARRS
jgi:uncharacterized repeat protein (TIGR01451 family)